MSASTLSRRACTAVFCAAFASFLNVPAFAQSLSYMPVDRFGTLLPEVMQPPGQQSETPYGGQESPALRRQVVSYASRRAARHDRHRYHPHLPLSTLGSGKAIRYGIGVGRAGFTWSGIETISRKTEWPDWLPPAEMIARQPYLPRWVGRRPGKSARRPRALSRQHRLPHPRHQ